MAKLINLTSENNRFEDVGYRTPENARAIGIVGEVVLVDEDGNVVVSLGGGGVGGGSNVYSNLGGDFDTSANTGTRTFDILGPPFVVEAGHVACGSVKRMDAAGNATDVELTSVVVTGTTGGYVVTVADEDDIFIGTDVINAFIIGPERAYDIPLDAEKDIVQNPEWSHYTDIITLLDITNSAVTGTQFLYIDGAGYRNWMWHLYAYDELITTRLWATLDEDDVAPVAGSSITASSSWFNITNDYFGSDALTGTTLGGGSINVLKPLGSDYMPDAFLFEYDFTTTGPNALQLYLRKL